MSSTTIPSIVTDGARAIAAHARLAGAAQPAHHTHAQAEAARHAAKTGVEARLPGAHAMGTRTDLVA